MVVDAQGLLWITDPWLALLGASLLMGLVLWCHAWIATGRPFWPLLWQPPATPGDQKRYEWQRRQNCASLAVVERPRRAHGPPARVAPRRSLWHRFPLLAVRDLVATWQPLQSAEPTPRA